MIGSIISAVGALGSTIYGAVKSGQYNRQAQEELDRQRAENKKWYDMKMAQDYTQRSDVRNILNKNREMMDEQYKRARATNLVAGGTDESLALQQEKANEALSNTMSDIASGATAYKEGVESAYRQQENALSNAQRTQFQSQAQAVADAASKTGEVIGKIADPIDEAVDPLIEARKEKIGAIQKEHPDWDKRQVRQSIRKKNA